MANLKKYEDWSADDASAEKEELDKLDPGSTFYKLEAGKNLLRFLPPMRGTKSPMPGIFQHYVEIPGKEQGQSVVCVAVHAEPKRPCPVCQRAQALQASRSSRDQELGKKLVAKRRHYANVIDRRNEEKGPQVVAFPKTVYELLLAIRDDDSAGGNFTDPGPKGFDITITKTGSGLSTSYKVAAARDCTPLCEDAAQAEEWLESMHPLGKYSQTLSNKEILEKLGWEDDVSEEEDRPAPRGRGASRRAMDDAEDA